MMKTLWIAGLTALALAATPAAAKGNATGAGSGTALVPLETAAGALAPNQFLWTDTAAADPVTVLISIADQRAYVYRADKLVAVSSVSTGKDGKETPTGSYTILQKKEAHRSNLYDASMPFMQRLTWDGIAIHAGRNPGFPASHGCIRVPAAFAKKLYAVTGLGTTVTVVDEAVDPSLPPPPPIPAPDAGEVARANAGQIAAR